MLPERPERDDELERERRESTDLGYRDTEEEEAYEEAAEGETPGQDEPPVGGGD